MPETITARQRARLEEILAESKAMLLRLNVLINEVYDMLGDDEAGWAAELVLGNDEKTTVAKVLRKMKVKVKG